jgi:hypothetical protein
MGNEKSLVVGRQGALERHTIAETAQRFKKTEDEVRRYLARSREKAIVGAQQAAAAGISMKESSPSPRWEIQDIWF